MVFQLLNLALQLCDFRVALQTAAAAAYRARPPIIRGPLYVHTPGTLDFAAPFGAFCCRHGLVLLQHTFLDRGIQGIFLSLLLLALRLLRRHAAAPTLGGRGDGCFRPCGRCFAELVIHVDTLGDEALGLRDVGVVRVAEGAAHFDQFLQRLEKLAHVTVPHVNFASPEVGVVLLVQDVLGMDHDFLEHFILVLDEILADTFQRRDPDTSQR
mmetsp:Transcript_106763/g.344479  ORF Transcript_106763/g.344479 Transcript_106763/m.344479 type:complete len:212 (+) Transcript_106763:116-751(+)